MICEKYVFCLFELVWLKASHSTNTWVVVSKVTNLLYIFWIITHSKWMCISHSLFTIVRKEYTIWILETMVVCHYQTKYIICITFWPFQYFCVKNLIIMDYASAKVYFIHRLWLLWMNDYGSMWIVEAYLYKLTKSPNLKYLNILKMTSYMRSTLNVHPHSMRASVYCKKVAYNTYTLLF